MDEVCANKYESQLREKYSAIFKDEMNRPNWAYHKKSNPKELVLPTVPFVGESYNKLKVLVYASAENLSWYRNRSDHLDNDELAICRHRVIFLANREHFFPKLHIRPFDIGPYAVVVAYILYKEFKIEFDKPIDLLQHIAVANFGKFTIQNSTNTDYANKVKYLKFSFPYVRADLGILNPNLIIMPKTIYAKKAVKEIIGNRDVIAIYQIVKRIINRYIKNYPEPKNIPDWLKGWLKKLEKEFSPGHKTHQNFYSIFSYLESLLE